MLGAQIAFRKYKIRLGIWGSEWVGLYQFRKFFSSYYFVRVIGNTLRLSLYSIIVGFPLPIIFALQMNAMRSSRVRNCTNCDIHAALYFRGDIGGHDFADAWRAFRNICTDLQDGVRR